MKRKLGRLFARVQRAVKRVWEYFFPSPPEPGIQLTPPDETRVVDTPAPVVDAEYEEIQVTPEVLTLTPRETSQHLDDTVVADLLVKVDRFLNMAEPPAVDDEPTPVSSMADVVPPEIEAGVLADEVLAHAPEASPAPSLPEAADAPATADYAPVTAVEAPASDDDAVEAISAEAVEARDEDEDAAAEAVSLACADDAPVTEVEEAAPDEVAVEAVCAEAVEARGDAAEPVEATYTPYVVYEGAADVFDALAEADGAAVVDDERDDVHARAAGARDEQSERPAAELGLDATSTAESVTPRVDDDALNDDARVHAVEAYEEDVEPTATELGLAPTIPVAGEPDSSSDDAIVEPTDADPSAMEDDLPPEPIAMAAAAADEIAAESLAAEAIAHAAAEAESDREAQAELNAAVADAATAEAAFSLAADTRASDTSSDDAQHEPAPAPMGFRTPVPPTEVPSDYVPAAESGHALYQLQLDGFEGPLDLLLHLIKRHHVDIFDIPIAFICERYLVYLKAMEDLDIDVAAEFLFMASELLHLKSRMLLPKPEGETADEDEVDPRAELVRRLLEYQKYKDAAEKFGTLDRFGRDIFGRNAEPVPPATGEAPLKEVGLFALVSAFEAVLKRQKPEVRHQVMLEQVSVRQRIRVLVQRMEAQTPLSFDDLLAGAQRRMDIVVTFLALLEMGKLKLIRIFQSDDGVIYVHPKFDDASLAFARLEGLDESQYA